MTQMEDTLKSRSLQESMRVRDLSELVAESTETVDKLSVRFERRPLKQRMFDSSPSEPSASRGAPAICGRFLQFPQRGVTVRFGLVTLVTIPHRLITRAWPDAVSA